MEIILITFSCLIVILNRDKNLLAPGIHRDLLVFHQRFEICQVLHCFEFLGIVFRRMKHNMLKYRLV